VAELSPTEKERYTYDSPLVLIRKQTLFLGIGVLNILVVLVIGLGAILLEKQISKTL
jgi:hypothetical protein